MAAHPGNTVYENPSADRFEPPPPPPEPGNEQPRRRFILPLLLLALTLLTQWLRSHPERGSLTAVAAIGVLVGGVLHFVAQRKERDAIEGCDPYTPSRHITR